MAAWLFIILSLTSFLLVTKSEQTEYDVIIMGAGVAGITAAKVLYEAGITNILIIEAQDYIGGRLKTVEFADYSLNGGGSWIQGLCIDNDTLCAQYETNPMLDLAYKYNISFRICDWDDTTILDFGGEEHDDEDTERSYNEWEKAQSCVERVIQSISDGTIDDMRYNAVLYLCGWTDPHTAIDKTVQWEGFEFNLGEDDEWGSTFGSSGAGSYDLYGPQDAFVIDPKGYNGIALGLADEFLDIDTMLKLNAPITAIEYDEDGVTVTLDDSNGNETYYAKYGIVTFSLGVLQSDIVEFVPSLPSWKLDALLKFEMADYTPVYVKWPYNFWNSTLNSSFILFNDERFGFFPWALNLNHPDYKEGSLIWRFDIAMNVADMVANEDINDTITQIIDLKLRHYFDDVPRPDDVLVSAWKTNRYTQGSYSIWPIGFGLDDIDAMKWHINKLFFAGEHYEPFDHDYGYVQSAYLSGNDTANRILSCMGFNVDETNGFECPDEYKESEEEKKGNEDILWWMFIVAVGIGGFLIGAAVVAGGFALQKKNAEATPRALVPTIDTDDEQ